MSENNTESTTATAEQETAKPDTGGPDLTAEVEKWKSLARKHEAEAKSGKDAAKRLSEIEEANKSETEKAIAAARREAEESVRAEVRRERVLDRIEVLAAKDFADAEDARLRLGARADEFVGKEGEIDPQAISAALSQLLKDKPHLAAKGDGRPKGDADQGPRPNSKAEPSPGLGRLQAAYASKTP
jgi:flagellar biosynthesis/type III secretory pathway protein FliH